DGAGEPDADGAEVGVRVAAALEELVDVLLDHARGLLAVLAERDRGVLLGEHGLVPGGDGDARVAPADVDTGDDPGGRGESQEACGASALALGVGRGLLEEPGRDEVADDAGRRRR